MPLRITFEPDRAKQTRQIYDHAEEIKKSVVANREIPDMQFLTEIDTQPIPIKKILNNAPTDLVERQNWDDL
jgi:hypothetical protein